MVVWDTFERISKAVLASVKEEVVFKGKHFVKKALIEVCLVTVYELSF